MCVSYRLRQKKHSDAGDRCVNIAATGKERAGLRLIRTAIVRRRKSTSEKWTRKIISPYPRVVAERCINTRKKEDS